MTERGEHGWRIVWSDTGELDSKDAVKMVEKCKSIQPLGDITAKAKKRKRGAERAYEELKGNVWRREYRALAVDPQKDDTAPSAL